MNLRRLAFTAGVSLAAASLLPASATAAPLEAPFAVDLSGAVGTGAGSSGVALAAPGLRAPAARAEPVKFAGSAAITGRVLLDPVFNGPPVLELVIDLTGIAGVGSSTGRSYVSAGQAVVQRPLKAADVIQVTFPFYVDGDPGSARTGIATLNVTYSEVAGLNVSGTIGTPSF